MKSPIGISYMYISHYHTHVHVYLSLSHTCTYNTVYKVFFDRGKILYKSSVAINVENLTEKHFAATDQRHCLAHTDTPILHQLKRPICFCRCGIHEHNTLSIVSMFTHALMLDTLFDAHAHVCGNVSCTNENKCD